MLGFGHSKFGHFKNSIKYFELAIENCEDEIEIVEVLRNISNAFLELDNKDEAINTFSLRGIPFLSSNEAIFKLYVYVAEYFKKINDTFLCALSLQKALSYNPNDTDIIFELGLNYSKLNLDTLSYHNYSRLNSSVSYNNIGVALGNFGIEGIGNDYFRNSFNKDETLAASNLANQYIGAGFYKEARELLESAFKKEVVNDRVYQSMHTLKNKEKEENEHFEKLVLIGKKHDLFIKKYSDIIFENKLSLLNIEGEWKISDNEIIILKKVDNELIAEWGNFIKQFRLKFDKFDSAYKIEYAEKETSSSYWSSSLNGYGYYEEKDKSLNILITNKLEPIEFKLLRNRTKIVLKTD